MDAYMCMCMCLCTCAFLYDAYVYKVKETQNFALVTCNCSKACLIKSVEFQFILVSVEERHAIESCWNVTFVGHHETRGNTAKNCQDKSGVSLFHRLLRCRKAVIPRISLTVRACTPMISMALRMVAAG